jgi:uncharacterized LabA/DUF88 family protein
MTRNRHLIRASAYTGIDPENGSQRRFVDFLSANGYRVVCRTSRSTSGRIKADLDVEMTLDVYMMSDKFDVVVLITGDGDFKRLVEVVQQKGVRVEVVGFGASTSGDLIAMADQFTEISTIPEIFRNSSAPQPTNGDIPAASRDALNGTSFALNRPRPA